MSLVFISVHEKRLAVTYQQAFLFITNRVYEQAYIFAVNRVYQQAFRVVARGTLFDRGKN